MAARTGYECQVGMDASSATSTEQYEVLDLPTLNLAEELVDTSGLRGERSHASERVRQGIRSPSVRLRLAPNSVELDALLPRILGAAEVADVFGLADSLPTFVLNVDLGQKRWPFTGCKINRATFSGSAGQPLELELEIEALDVTPTDTAFPTLTISTVGHYMFHDLTATVGGTEYKFRSFKLTLDNVLETGRHLNSQTRVSLPEKDRIVTWELDGPYGDNVALYGLAVAGVACVATFVNGNRSVQFSSTKVQFPRQAPTGAGFDEIFLPLTGIARKDGSTLELVVTNDSTG